MSTSFLYGTIPFMKAMEKMTNPCFQDKDFAKVMKGKHMKQDPDEFCCEFESAEASVHVEEEGLIVKILTKDRFAPDNQYSPPVVNSSISNAIKTSRVRTKMVLYNIQPPKKKKRDWYAPDNQYSLPVVNSSILFPIRVTREKLNCAFGNTVNLLTYINHFIRT